MLIRMKKLAAGPEGVLESGEEYDLEHWRALSLIQCGAAEALDAPAKAETAAKKPAVETTALRTGKQKPEKPTRAPTIATNPDA